MLLLSHCQCFIYRLSGVVKCSDNVGTNDETVSN